MEVEEVDMGLNPWVEVCLIQFAGVADDDARKVSKAAPQIPMLGGSEPWWFASLKWSQATCGGSINANPLIPASPYM